MENNEEIYQDTEKQDPPVKKLYDGLFKTQRYTKSFDEFKTQYSTKESIAKLHTGLSNSKSYTKGEDEFVNQYFPEVKKKEDLPLQPLDGQSSLSKSEKSTSILFNAGGQQQVKSEPYTPIAVESKEKVDTKGNIFDDAKNYFSLKNTTKEIANPDLRNNEVPTIIVPDEDAVKKSKEVQDKYKDTPIDLEEISTLTQKLNFSPKQTEEYNEIAKKNPENFIRKVNHQTWLTPFWKNKNKVLSQAKADNNFELVKTIEDGITAAYEQGSGKQGYKKGRENVVKVGQAIRGVIGDNNDYEKAHAVTASIVYGTALIPQKNTSGKWEIPIELDSSPEELQQLYDANLNYYHRVGLDYLKDLKPNEYEAYKGIEMIKDNDIQKESYEVKFGKQEKAIRVEEMGINLAYKAAKEQLNDAIAIGDADAVGVYEAAVTKIQNDYKTLEDRYPLLKLNDATIIAKEIANDDPNKLRSFVKAVDRFIKKTGVSTKNMVTSVWDLASQPFRSEENYQKNLMYILGDKSLDENITYLKQDNQIEKTFKVTNTKEIQAKIDEIKNSNLSATEKESKLTDLAFLNKGEFSKKAIEPTTNLSLKSIAYGVSDLAATLAPFIVSNMATGGTSSVIGAFTKEFSIAAMSMYHETLADAIQRGDTNPYASAFRRTAINSLAMAGAGTAGEIRKLAMGSKNIALKNMVKSMDDKAITAMIDVEKASTLKTIGKAIGNKVIQSAQSAAKITPAIQGGAMANEYIDSGDVNLEQNVTSMGIEALKFFIFGSLAGIPKSLRAKPNEMGKLSIIESATKSPIFLKEIDSQLQEGKITNEQHTELKTNIELAKKVYDNTPMVNEKGNQLSDAKARELMYLKFQEAKANELLKKDIPEKLIETTNAELATVKEEIAKVQGDEVDTKLSVPIEGVNEQGVPIGENVPPPVEIIGEGKVESKESSQTEKNINREQKIQEEGLQLELAPLVLIETPETIKRAKEIEENNNKVKARIKEIDAEFDAKVAGSVGVGGDVETKQQIENFGVPKEDVESVNSVISQVFNGLKNAGLTAAKTVSDWVGIGKGGVEKPYTLKMNGKDVQVKNVQPEVVNGFYSPLEKIITDSKFDKLPTKQWIEKYANSEEAQFTGLKDWLAQQEGSVSKKDIQQYLKDNRIQVVEVVKGDDLIPVELNFAKKDFDVDDYNATIGSYEEIEYVLEDKEVGYEIIKTDEFFYIRDSRGENIFKDGDYNNEIKSLEEAKRVAGLHLAESNVRSTDGTKFSQYQLEGEKENYKEVLVTMPVKLSADELELKALNKKSFSSVSMTDADTKRAAELQTKLKGSLKTKLVDNSFKSSHFDEPNILVHLRMNTRTDAEGKKVLFLEEVQSDWGQQGKKEGFKEDASQKEKDDLTFAIKRTIEEQNKNEKGSYNYNRLEETANSLRKRLRDLQSKTPSAPFVTDTNAWTKLGLKVALKEAVKQGADKIAWTTGEQQNERYNLSKSIDEIEWIKNDDGTYDLNLTKDDNEIDVPNRTGLSLNEIESLLGKDIAEKINNEVGKISDSSGMNYGSITGENLKVGGKGMKGFYGSPTEGSLGIVGNVAKSLFKQEPKTVGINNTNQSIIYKLEENSHNDLFHVSEYINGNFIRTVGEGDFTKTEGNDYALKLNNKNKSNSTQHSIDITPQLKASVEGGQPLFKDAEAQYRIENGKNIVEAIKDFNGSQRATVALTHEIMHPTVVAIINGAKENNEIGIKHTETIVSEFNKVTGQKVTIEDLIKGNDAFKDGTTSKQYRAIQEFIAKSWEKYHTEGGKGFSTEFQKVLEQITQAFKAVYNSLTGKQITPELRKMFDEILGKDKSMSFEEGGKELKEIEKDNKNQVIEKKNTGTEIEPVLEEGRKSVTLSGNTEAERQLYIEQRKKETKQTPMTSDRDKILNRIAKFNNLTKPQKRNAYQEANNIKLAVDSFNEKHQQKHKISKISSGDLELRGNPSAKKSFGNKLKNTLKGEEKNIIENGKPLMERDYKTKKVFNDLLDADVLPVSRRVNGEKMSEVEHDGTIQDIIDGIPSERAENYLNRLENQIKEDSFDYGNPDKNAAPVTLRDALSITVEASEPMSMEMVEKWLKDESEMTPEGEILFDNIDNLITHYEQLYESGISNKVQQLNQAGKGTSSREVKQNEQKKGKDASDNKSEEVKYEEAKKAKVVNEASNEGTSRGDEPITPKKDSTTKENVGEDTQGTGGGKEPPKEPIENDFLYSPNEQKRTSGLMKHLLEAKNIDESIKKEIKDKGLDKYEVANNAEAREVASQIVKSLDKDGALQIARMEDMHPSVRSAIYAEVIDNAFKLEQEAIKSGNKDAQMEAAAEWASVSKEYDKKLTSGGQFTAYAAHFYKQSPLGFVIKANESISKKFEDWAKDKDTDLKEVFKLITETEQGESLINKKVEELRKKERKAERKKRDKNIDDFFDGLKAKNDILYSAIIPPSVWNGAMDVLKVATKGGDRVVDAVQKAIEHITKNIGDDWDKERFRKEYEQKVLNIADAGVKEKSYEQVLRDRAIELKRRLNENDFSSEEYKDKKELSEKEKIALEDLKEVQDAYNEAKKKSPQYIDKKSKQYLDMVRGRLNKMDEKQKEDFIRRVSKKIIENGGLKYEEFRQELADVMGFKELTPEQVKRAEELTNNINVLNDVENKMIEERTVQSKLNYIEAQNKAAEAQNELFNMVAKKTDVINTFKSWYTGSLMGVQSLFINTLFNPIQQLTVRLPKSVLLNIGERGAKAISLAMNKLTGSPIYNPKLNILDAQKGYFGSFKPAINNAWFNFKKGTENRDLFGKNEYQTSLSPKIAASELAKFKKGEIYLTPMEVIDRKIRKSIFARQADLILRGMQFGDVVPRWMAEGAKSIQIAKNELDITDVVDLDIFMHSPEKMAKQILLKQGKSELQASKLAAEIKERIVFEGEKAVMQQPNLLKNISSGLDKGLTIKEKDELGMKTAKTSGSVLKTLTFPFIGIPANLAWEGFKLINPEISLGLSISQAAQAAYKAKKGDAAGAKKFFEMSKDNFAHSVLGATYLIAASTLVNAGLTASSNDEEVSAKERAGESTYGKQNQFNMGKAMGGTDFWVDNKFLGLFGTMLNVKSKQKDEILKKGAKAEVEDNSWVQDFSERVGYGGISQLNNLVFNNGAKIVSAINGGDAPFKMWMSQTTNGLSSLFTGGTYTSFSKAMLPEQVTLKGDGVVSEIIESQKQKNILLRLSIDMFGGNGTPKSKISIWGESIKNDRSVTGVLGNMLGWEKGSQDIFGAIIYDDYRRTGNVNFFPMPDDDKFLVNGEQVKLNKEQKFDLDVFVGQARKTFAKAVVYDMTKKYGGKVYSDLNDNEKIEALQTSYELAKEIGYANFIKKYPQFEKVKKTEEKSSKEMEKKYKKQELENELKSIDNKSTSW